APEPAAPDPAASLAPPPPISRPGCVAYSSESTSAYQDAAITFSETPIEPHRWWPSEASSSTRVIASVPFVSSRMRTLKLTRAVSAAWGVGSAGAGGRRLATRGGGPFPPAGAPVPPPPPQFLARPPALSLPGGAFPDTPPPRLQPEERLVDAGLLAQQQLERAV